MDNFPYGLLFMNVYFTKQSSQNKRFSIKTNAPIYAIINLWLIKKITINRRFVRCLSCFFALYNQIDRFRNNNGLHTNAIYGFHLMLDNLLERIQPTHVLVAFDAGKTTFRTEMFADYKAGRAKTQKEFREQLPYIREMLAARGIAYYDLAQYEADDIIGTLAKMAENTSEAFQITVVSGDKDLIQLTDENTVVEISKKGVAEFEAFTPDYLMEKMGITPAQFVDLKALMGDKSDNIPGLLR